MILDEVMEFTPQMFDYLLDRVRVARRQRIRKAMQTTGTFPQLTTPRPKGKGKGGGKKKC